MFVFSKKLLVFLSLIGLNALPNVGLCIDLKPSDKRDIGRIETYLNKINGLKANFLQVTSNGKVTTGKLFLSRPGKMRLEYSPPSPIMLVANGDFLVHIDRELQHNSHFFVDKTPLGFLLKEKIILDGELEIIKFSRGANTLVISISQAENKEQGTVSVVFSDNPLALKKWIINDAQGVKTTVSLSNPERVDTIDPKLFDLEKILDKQ